MENQEFIKLRHYLGKTQRQMSRLLGCSLKTIASFEQGQRRIPMHIERQTLFFLHMTRSHNERYKPCWVIKECPIETREHCPVWEFKAGHICWFINDTICHGRTRIDWQEKMVMCRQCRVFQAIMPDYHSSETTGSNVAFNPTRSKDALMEPVGQKMGDKRKTATLQLTANCIDQDRQITRTKIGTADNNAKKLEKIKNILSKFNELAQEIDRATRELGIEEINIEELMESTQTRMASSVSSH
jgi:DNA-binding XRE family transcriptional regulator